MHMRRDAGVDAASARVVESDAIVVDGASGRDYRVFATIKPHHDHKL